MENSCEEEVRREKMRALRADGWISKDEEEAEVDVEQDEEGEEEEEEEAEQEEKEEAISAEAVAAGAAVSLVELGAKEEAEEARVAVSALLHEWAELAKAWPVKSALDADAGAGEGDISPQQPRRQFDRYVAYILAAVVVVVAVVWHLFWPDSLLVQKKR